MFKFCFLIIIFTALSAATSAQIRDRYVFDNFDTKSGVSLNIPPPVVVEAKTKPLKNGKKNLPVKSQTINPRLQLTAMTRSVGEPSMRMANGRTLGSFSTGDAKVDGYILDSTARHGVDPMLIYATMSQESSFKPRAISYKGARGLMQLMPATAVRFGVTDIFSPQQNIEGGVKYLRFLLDTFKGDVKLALAGYNAGEGAVMKYGYTIPPYAETQNYVARISARYAMISNPNYARAILRAVSAPETAKNIKSVKSVPPPPPPPVYEAASLAIKLPNGKIQLMTR